MSPQGIKKVCCQTLQAHKGYHRNAIHWISQNYKNIECLPAGGGAELLSGAGESLGTGGVGVEDDASADVEEAGDTPDDC